METLMGLS